MKIFTKELTISTNGKIEIVDITDMIGKFFEDNSINTGTLTIYAKHATCAIIINEAETNLIKDIREDIKPLSFDDVDVPIKIQDASAYRTVDNDADGTNSYLFFHGTSAYIKYNSTNDDLDINKPLDVDDNTSSYIANLTNTNTSGSGLSVNISSTVAKMFNFGYSGTAKVYATPALFTSDIDMTISQGLTVSRKLSVSGSSTLSFDSTGYSVSVSNGSGSVGANGLSVTTKATDSATYSQMWSNGKEFASFMANGTFTIGDSVLKVLQSGKVGMGISSPVSIAHIYENTVNTSTTAGLTIEQDGTGDAITQYLLTGIRRWVTGIDNSDSDKFKIAYSADLGSSTALTIDVSGNVGIGTNVMDSKFHIYGGNSGVSPLSGSRAFIESAGATYLQFGAGATYDAGIIIDDRLNWIEHITYV